MTLKEILYDIIYEEVYDDCENKREADITTKALISDMSEEEMLEKIQEHEEQ